MKILLPLTLCLTLFIPASAETILAFGGDWVAESLDSGLIPEQRSGEPTTADSRIFLGSPTAKWAMEAKPSAASSVSQFYGGIEVVKLGTQISGGQAKLQVIDNSAEDYIRLRFQSPPGVTQAHFTAIVWWQVDFTYGDLVRITARSYGGMAGSVVSRIVLRDAEGTFYVSSQSITGGNGRQPWGIPNPSASAWTRWTPAEAGWTRSLNTDRFNDYLIRDSKITGVGWLADTELDNPSGKLYGSDVTIQSFEVITTH